MSAFIFDLDGTLIDSLGDITDAANHALRQVGQPTHHRADYRLMVGYGADVLLQKALPADAQHLVPEALVIFKQYYQEHPNTQTRLFPGIEQMLDELTSRGVPIAVLSNKPHANTEQIVQNMLGRWHWAAVRGHREGVPKKPAPDAALEIARELGMDPGVIWFVGDSEPDVQTATAARMQPIGVLWGYRDEQVLRQHGAERVIQQPAELLALLPGA